MTRLAAGIIAILGLAAQLGAQESWDQPAKITGVVLDENDVPIEGADVVLRPFLRPVDSVARLHSVFDPPLAVATTDLLGRFALAFPEWTTVPDFSYRSLVVVATDLERPGVASEMIGTHHRRTHRVTLRLPSLAPEQQGARTDRMRFLASDGTPLAGVRVASIIGVSTGPSLTPSSSPVVGRTETTDAHGYAFIAPDRWLLVARRGEQAVPIRSVGSGSSVVVPEHWEWPRDDGLRSPILSGDRDALPDPDDVSAALRRRAAQGGEIAGRVVGPDGNPIAGAEVLALYPGAMLDPVASLVISQRRPWEAFAQTDPAGRFVIRHLPVGTYRLQAAAPHLAPVLTASMEVMKDRRTAAAQIALHPGASLILHGTGDSPRIRGADADRGTWSYWPDGPDEVIDGLPPGLIQVTAWTSVCQSGPARTIEIPKSGTVEVDFAKPEEEPTDRRRIARR